MNFPGVYLFPSSSPSLYWEATQIPELWTQHRQQELQEKLSLSGVKSEQRALYSTETLYM